MIMKSEFPMSSPTSFDAVTTSPVIDFGHVRPFGEQLGLAGLSSAADVVLEEETLVVDDRSGLSPAEMVESKLSRKLQETSLPVSHLQTRGLLRRR